MPLDDHPTVIVRIPLNDGLGEAMKRIRIWLDGEKIFPAKFTTAVEERGFKLTIGFRSQEVADRFRQQFPT